MRSILYGSKKIEKSFLNIEVLKKKCGMALTKQILKRMSQLNAFENVYDLINAPIDNPHFLEGKFKGCIGWSLTGNIRLILDTGKNNNLIDIDELKELKEITIIGVVDYHGGKNEWIIN